MNKQDILDYNGMKWINIDKYKEYEETLKIANEMKDIQGQNGNYNFDSYMLGIYNGMEYVIALFEKREAKFIDGHKISFLN